MEIYIKYFKRESIDVNCELKDTSSYIHVLKNIKYLETIKLYEVPLDQNIY